MSTAAMKMNTVTVKDQETGRGLITLRVPEGWTSTANIERNNYCGYGHPYLVQIRNNSPDGKAAIFFRTTSHFRDDHLESHSDFSTDLYGNLYHRFNTAEQYMESWVNTSLKNETDVKLIRQTDWPDNAQDQERLRKSQIADCADDPYTVIDRVYRKGIIREYSFVHNNHRRRRAYSLLVKGVEYAVWRPIPAMIVQQLNNIFMRDIFQMALSTYPNARYDEINREWIYTLSYFVDWTVSEKFILDAREEEFDALYQNAFRPTLAGAGVYTKDLRADMDAVQAKINARNKAARDENNRVREQNKAEADRRRAEEERRRESDRQAREKLRKTQKEIEEIRRSTYENTQRTQAKVREMWSDTFRGDTRFVDKYGNEHVVHTYDNYAYKSGDKYITSNSPLDHGWDWEELEKKKY